MAVQCHCQCPGHQQALSGYGALGQEGEAAAAATTSSLIGVSPMYSIGIGVATGLTVWFLTRLLDGGHRRRRRR